MAGFPFPHQTALAICSDLDETPDAETYFELMRFLNTTDSTSMGEGVGLEAGNTLYFDMAPGHFSYWNTDDQSREKIRTLIKSGHIDCLHSYGDLATTRAHAGRALEELDRYGCRIPVWIDHAQAPTNFGADIMQGHGDEPGHPAYHADLTLAHGIRYIWRGRVTSVIGQDRSFNCGGIADWSHPVDSSVTVAKEITKHIMARCGSAKYRLHASNRLLQLGQLRDQSAICEFLRCNPHWRGVSACDTGWGLAEVLTPRFLDQLVARKTWCVLYTHMGKLNGERKFNPATVAAFRRLAEYQRAKKINVMTTARLLDAVAGINRLEQGAAAVQVPLKYPEL